MAQATLIERVERKILPIRGHKVMLDSDLAELYGVKAIRLREQVKRNREWKSWYRKMRYLPEGTWEGTFLMSSPKKGLPCCPVFFVASGPS